MLNSFRTFSGSFIVKILMALLVFSFALWGVGDVLKTTASNKPVATVGGIKITPPQFAAALRNENENLRQMMGSQYSAELAASMQLPQRVLQRLVQQSLLTLEAKSIGIVPSDADILKRITTNPSFADSAGKFDKSQFQAILGRTGLSEKKYIERLRADMASEQLADLLSTSVSQSEIAARTLYEARKGQRTATLYTLPSSLVKNSAAPTDENLEAYYKAHAQEFSVPEFRTLSYATIAASDIPTDDEAAQNFINKIDDAFA
ncbi:MAG: hypothetical protein EBR02_05225, partial [Alphaproteobacteria bacterium]|nr:hypothetical protein [Alphaproteobacteria bacterium]